MKPNKENALKIAKGAGVAAVGAVLTYLADAIPLVEFGDFTPIVVSIFSILANYVRKIIEQKT